MNRVGILLCFLVAAAVLPLRARPAPARDLFNVKTFGATGDGRTLDHAALNRAIDAAHAAGGGTVLLPAGSYLCFSVHLRSNVTIQFAPGATLLAASPPKAGPGGYDPPEPNPADPYEDFGHSHWHNSLLWGENLENVAIVGPGLIHGRGLSNGGGAGSLDSLPADDPARQALPANPPFGYPNRHDSLRSGIGNKAIALKNCRRVTLRDFSILHGGHFGILATGVDNLVIDKLKIDTNRDGIDIDACHNVRVTDCSVNSPYDDGICLKSSYGLGLARATENVTISGCCLSGSYREGTMLDGTRQELPPGDKAFRTGRIKLGTESNGGFRRIVISNCIFDRCNGLAIESVDGGIIEDVVASNLTMLQAVNAPIFIRLGRRLRGPEGTAVGAIRRVIISNVTISGSTGRYGSILSGLPGHPLEDIQINNVRAVQGGGGTAADAVIQPPEREADYPEPTMFGPMPSWGFYVRHCAGLEMRGVGLKTEAPDARPCIVLDDVAGADFDGLRTPPREPGQALFSLRNVRDFTARSCAGLPDTRRETASEERF